MREALQRGRQRLHALVANLRTAAHHTVQHTWRAWQEAFVYRHALLASNRASACLEIVGEVQGAQGRVRIEAGVQQPARGPHSENADVAHRSRAPRTRTCPYIPVHAAQHMYINAP